LGAASEAARHRFRAPSNSQRITISNVKQRGPIALPPLPPSGERTLWQGLPGAAAALALSDAAERFGRPVVAVVANEGRAYELESELRFFASGEVPVVHFPDTEVLPYDGFSPHQEILSDRMAALYRLPSMTHGIVILTADALLARLPPRAWLDGRAFELTVGQRLDPIAFRERLVAAGYQSVSEVQTQGEFAVRGALVDLFPMGSAAAYRIDLFDDEIETIRVFDPETQRSTEQVKEVRMLPARDFPTDKSGIETFRANYRAYFAGDPSRSRIYTQVSKALMPGGIEAYLPLFFEHTESIFDYLPATAWVAEVGELHAALDADWQQIAERHERLAGDIERPLMKPLDLFHAPGAAMERLAERSRVAISAAPSGSAMSCELLPRSPDTVQALLGEAPRILFVAESPGRREALNGWLKPKGVVTRDCGGWHDYLADNRRYCVALGPMQDGLKLPDGSLIIAEAQIFGLRAEVSRRRKPVRDPETLLKDLSELSIGSPVVHAEHGVGRYQGLTRLDAGGITAEYLVIEYAGGDKIYVPVASLQLIHRYTGAEEQAAPLHSLGSDRWAKAQERARKRAHDVAAELLQIQARRAARPGMAMDVNDEDYRRFCDGFPFETTPDQQRSIEDVLADMAADKPMDRVVCGDVGFGKTEVALRASFAAINNNRQVCVLVPTTLLAQQHYKNFADRYSGWPVRVGVASRLKTDKDLKTLLADLEAGRLDVVIGTHRLLQPDVKFKNLGLVIVDEEHRFGVRHKERLKNLRAEVDLLTLTATPIPRTLNMSLAGLRDLSIIATPPEARLAIRTFVADWDRNLVYEACLRELKRGGQVFYLHNEVKDIERAAQSLGEIVPEARVRFAHGQMRAAELEQVMLDFYHHRFDILVSTTIIESGIDIPNANTIVVNRADTLGLAQLHQLRGRVGRSHHRAYAYLLVPSKRALSADAEKRLEAIESMGELGSGFLLATHDLEIRGAGELLGDDQSGQIEEVGFTMYADLLARAVAAIKSGKLADAPFEHGNSEVDLGATALIPDDYVPDIATRLSLYKRLAESATQQALLELRYEMIDRFGPLPEAAFRLWQAAALKLAAQALGITRIRAGKSSLTLDFAAQTQLDPVKLIQLIQNQPKRYRLEGQSKLHYLGTMDPPENRPLEAAALLERLGAPPLDLGS